MVVLQISCNIQFFDVSLISTCSDLKSFPTSAIYLVSWRLVSVAIFGKVPCRMKIT